MRFGRRTLHPGSRFPRAGEGNCRGETAVCHRCRPLRRLPAVRLRLRPTRGARRAHASTCDPPAGCAGGSSSSAAPATTHRAPEPARVGPSFDARAAACSSTPPSARRAEPESACASARRRASRAAATVQDSSLCAYPDGTPPQPRRNHGRTHRRGRRGGAERRSPESPARLRPSDNLERDLRLQCRSRGTYAASPRSLRLSLVRADATLGNLRHDESIEPPWICPVRIRNPQVDAVKSEPGRRRPRCGR